MHTESRFKPEVVSHKGACGLMQLLPGTAKEMGVKEIFDPEQNIMGGTRYLRMLANRFDGDTVKMVAGYHAGGGAVSAANGIPYEKTGEYLRRVLNAYYAYQKKLPTEGP
jgi:soluble lytic murein transglycosylase-like protein